MFKNMSVKAKLSALLGLLSVLLLLIGFLGLYGMSLAVEGLRTVYNDRTIPLQQLGQIRADLLWNRIAITAAVADPNPAFVREQTEKVTKNLEDIDTIWEKYMGTYLTPEEKRLADKFAVDYPKLKEQGMEMAVAQLQAGDAEAAASTIATKIRPLYEPVAEGMDALVALQDRVAREEFEKAEAEYSNILAISIASIAVGVILAILLGMMIIRSITNPLARAVDLANRLADGDLTHQVEVAQRMKSVDCWTPCETWYPVFPELLWKSDRTPPS